MTEQTKYPDFLFPLLKKRRQVTSFNHMTMSFYVNSVNDNVTCTINSHFYVSSVLSIFCNCLSCNSVIWTLTTKYMTNLLILPINKHSIYHISVISVVHVGYIIFSDLEPVLFNFRNGMYNCKYMYCLIHVQLLMSIIQQSIQ